jgi:hypothetical protein
MPGLSKADRAALERLEAIRADWERMAAEMQRLRARRDFLIVAAHRRGISTRRIADAVGVHFTRVAQLAADAAQVARDTGLTPITRKGNKSRL